MPHRRPRTTFRPPASLRVAVSLALVLAVLTTSSTLLAERPNLNESGKQAESTHAVVGKVIGLYQKTRPKHLDRTEHLVEIEVRDVEKGDGLAAGDIVYARVWRSAPRRGLRALTPPAPGPSGHGPIPRTGDLVRAWLARGKYPATRQTDRGYAVLYPNGIEVLIDDR